MKFSSDLVIYDLEGSCKTFGKNEINETNIIEIGAVKLDKKTFEIKSEFSILIKPKHFPILPEITDITNITNEMVENEKYFDEAILLFLDWYGEKKIYFSRLGIVLRLAAFEKRIYRIWI
ncbi:exonuclease domain-containing protein [Chryseobacterium sp. ERMR1:04]|uniref:exonuclease domain-containing protein n=1 Tax=Chryseobacterium sp. ERMR1:04 TaxID=1705393 RepID=UPI000AF7D84C|nr:exonuclease domain-containing protein [Chryseobacterium sp. ERMR1:04]